MLTGKRFKLENPTLALSIVEGKRTAVTIPTGSIVKIVSGPRVEEDRMVDVIWKGRVLTMFAADVNVRGTEITAKSAGA